MNGVQAAFAVWAACGLLFLGIGIFDMFSEKQVRFWANAESPEMKQIKKYNRAVGILLCVYAIVFVLLGLPLLLSDSDLALLIPVLGTVAETIALMTIYMKIEQKYKK